MIFALNSTPGWPGLSLWCKLIRAGVCLPPPHAKQLFLHGALVQEVVAGGGGGIRVEDVPVICRMPGMRVSVLWHRSLLMGTNTKSLNAVK